MILYTLFSLFVAKRIRKKRKRRYKMRIQIIAIDIMDTNDPDRKKVDLRVLVKNDKFPMEIDSLFVMGIMETRKADILSALLRKRMPSPIIEVDFKDMFLSYGTIPITKEDVRKAEEIVDENKRQGR